MISMTPACTTWCIKWWICGWSYWLNTISSTMITFSLVHARSVFCCRASVLVIFKSLYFTRQCSDTFWVWWNLWWLFYCKVSGECASEGIM